MVTGTVLAKWRIERSGPYVMVGQFEFEKWIKLVDPSHAYLADFDQERSKACGLSPYLLALSFEYIQRHSLSSGS
ncbi:hypothetical protein N7504_009423 [Penicillium tannophilum]|nr:hypothetical protein N7504_009423 [Penicillium tannophilum]